MGWWSAALDLLLGGRCLGCGQPGRSLCRGCSAALVPDLDQVTRVGEHPIWSAVRYEGVVKRLIPAFKDDQAWQLRRPLGELLAAAILAAAPPTSAVLVPVPSIAARVRSRGLDHCRSLVTAAQASLHPRLPIRPLLRRLGNHRQVGLTKAERDTNLRDRFAARPGGCVVLLCDDVVTTGATLREAAHSLTEAGHLVLGCCVISDTQLHHSSLARQNLSDIPQPVDRNE